MSLLKEDGSLDIERINKLPIDEHIKEIEALTEKQYKEYLSKLPLNESRVPMNPVTVEYTLEEDVEQNGIVNAEDVINNIGKMFKTNNEK